MNGVILVPHTRKEFYADSIDENELVGIGLMLIKVVKQIDLCFAGMILTTESLITETPQPEPPMPGGMPGGGMDF